ncbi:MAG: xanthine dehydrogenase family protein molybdopterin-binding subunit [Acidimicrobiia bacterium]|nr:xanthine dehydrogenase family protein molybdopterin-binding subunit [Acidimicrobiia bacterium]
MVEVQGSILGNAVLRREDPSLLMGSDKYYDDMDVPGVGYLHFVRSPFAHARIDSIDTSEAESMAGVAAVYTSDTLELPDFQGFEMLDPAFNRPMLAKGKVRFVGDIVAAVVADTREIAADAVEAVVVDYDPLPAVTDMEAAMADGAPVLFEDHGSNICFATALGAEEGDPDPLDGADKVAEVRMVSQRLAGVPMEPNGCIAIPEGDSLEVWVPSQNPVAIKDAYVGLLGLDPDKVRVAAPTVGGGFGPKAGPYTEHFLTIRIAQTLGRPVKWTEERSENMVSLGHGRAMVMSAKLGVKDDGTIVGIDADVSADAGAYPGIGSILPMLTQMMIQGVYNVPTIRFQARSAATNTTTTVAYRGAGRPEATQLIERVMDVAADELGMDPAELRRKNYLQPGAFPLTTKSGANYDSGEYEKALDAVLEAADYQSLLAEQAERRTSGAAKQLGIGLSSYVEVTAPIGLHVEYGAVEINDDGTATAKVGTSAHGQGHLTAFSMIVSDMLGIPMENVKLLQSDTADIPRGAGTMGSRSLQTAGSAVHVASETVLAKGKKLAAHLLEASEDDIVTGDNGLQVAGVPTSAMSWAELAAAANDDSKRPEGMEPGLSHELDFDGSDSTYPFGSHLSVVEVDTETGQVQMLRHVAVDDCGKILNPLLVTGQQHGGIAQGAAQALYEIVQYDDSGNPITSNLMDYAIPSAAELASFETSNTETPSPRNPLGAKGIGESGTIGSTPAIHNAVVDAVSHLGVRHIDMPLSAQTVWSAIQTAS